MTIFEKITQSKDLQKVYLYKEGVFWIAYEQSAYLVSQVKALKPTKKFVKTVGQEVVSVGFPDTALANVLLSFRLVSQSDTQVVVESSQAIELSAFEAWKSELPLRTAENVSKDNVIARAIARSNPVKSNDLDCFTPFAMTENTEISILKKLRIFSLADKTPIECMFFLSDLQKQLQLYGDVR